jgi:hypothetical protein
MKSSLGTEGMVIRMTSSASGGCRIDLTVGSCRSC